MSSLAYTLAQYSVIELAMLSISDNLWGCTYLAESLLSTNTDAQSLNTTRCVYVVGTSEWLQDPCCNTNVVDSCCLAEDRNYSVASYEVAGDLNAICKDGALASGVLSNYIFSKTEAEDFSTGCRRTLDTTEFNLQTAFLTECLNLSPDVARKCTTSSDCLDPSLQCSVFILIILLLF